jgi:hypothetical protein
MKEEKKRAAPNGPQKYRGNGQHTWEPVAEWTTRLRVAGGWLYRHHNALGTAMVFVPVPEVVGYKV